LDNHLFDNKLQTKSTLLKADSVHKTTGRKVDCYLFSWKWRYTGRRFYGLLFWFSKNCLNFFILYPTLFFSLSLSIFLSLISLSTFLSLFSFPISLPSPFPTLSHSEFSFFLSLSQCSVFFSLSLALFFFSLLCLTYSLVSFYIK
jgi:hypothetical protein